MPSVCFYFQVHQPYRLRSYGVFDIGRRRDYFDDARNEQILHRVAHKCYIPMNALLLELIDRFEGRFRLAFSITGTVLEQMELWEPRVLQSFRALVRTGCVELLAETDQHSLGFVADIREFDAQVEAHSRRIETLFGVRPRVFRNTELIANESLAHHVEKLGLAGMLVEGADRVLGWRSPHFVYTAVGAPRLPLLLKSYRLSDDIAFRFGNRDWRSYPLYADKFASWIHATNGMADCVNLFMDYETFGEHQWADTGIFEFMRGLPDAVLGHPDVDFATPSEVVSRYRPVAELSIPDFVSWADLERDLSAWLDNDMQRDALAALYQLRDPVLLSSDPELIRDWRRLTASDHLYYMCTKWFSDGDVHKYFSPYDSPYDAYITFTSVLCDLAQRAGVARWSPLPGM